MPRGAPLFPRSVISEGRSSALSIFTARASEQLQSQSAEANRFAKLVLRLPQPVNCACLIPEYLYRYSEVLKFISDELGDCTNLSISRDERSLAADIDPVLPIQICDFVKRVKEIRLDPGIRHLQRIPQLRRRLCRRRDLSRVEGTLHDIRDIDRSGEMNENDACGRIVPDAKSH